MAECQKLRHETDTAKSERSELMNLLELKSNFIATIQERLSVDKHNSLEPSHLKPDSLFVEMIQKLSFCVIRLTKGTPELKLDAETAENVRSLMDESVFALLDKTEIKLQKL